MLHLHKYRRDFETALGMVKWPHITVASDSITGSSENLLKLVVAAEYLFLVSTYFLEPETELIKIWFLD